MLAFFLETIRSLLTIKKEKSVLVKTIKSLFAVPAGLMLASAIPALAIEALHLSVQCSNVVLSWPSAEGETYIVQYRQTLNPSDSWQTLTSSCPATSGTNITVYVHSNIVQNPGCGCDGGSFAAMISGGNALALAAAEPIKLMPMAIPTNGSGGAVPVVLYPPGFDLSGFVIFDPDTGESVSGAGYSTSAFSLSNPLLDGPQPLDGGSGSGGNAPAPETGFYQVVRMGAHLMGITNGTTLSGVVSIPVEVGNDSGGLVNSSLTEDDSPVGGSIQTAPFNFPLALTVDTTLMSNGVHQISASARWEDTNGGAWEADSPPVAVNVYNEISFPNWMPQFGQLGNSLLIWANSAHPSADWWIDIYDSHYAFVGTFAGHTDDGNIGGVWNLVGPYGELHTNDSFFIFVITTEFAGSSTLQNSSNGPVPLAGGGSTSAVTPKTYRVTDPWSGRGAWVAVAQHVCDGAIDHDLLYAELKGFVGAAQGNGGVSPPPYYDDEENLAPFAIHFQGGSEYADWATFRQALYNPLSRNLVYCGHGGPNNLGYNWSNTNVSISAKEIASMLHTIPAGQTNRHAFRFVFLDGCSTAKGTLPEAFGILHRENVSADEYNAAGLRRSAFVGWSAKKYITLFGIWINYDHVNFIVHIQDEMILNGVGIKEAVDRAARYPDVHWPFIWTSQMKVYGYGGLTLGLEND